MGNLNTKSVISEQNNLKRIKSNLDKKPTKKHISSKMRQMVWSLNMGPPKAIPCPCCEYTKIDPFNFECGHIKAESKGGETTIKNLKPICSQCNKSMGTKDLNQFKKSLRI